MTAASSTPRSFGARISWRFVTVVVSGALLYLLYRSVDVRSVALALRQSHMGWLALAIGLLVPITLMRALRFYWLLPPGTVQGFAEALRLTLVAGAFNVFLPAKAGDFSKSVIIARRGTATGSFAASVVVYERMSDLVGLTTWCLVGVALVEPVTPALPGIVWIVIAVIWALCTLLILSVRLARIAAGLAHGVKWQWLNKFSNGWVSLLTDLRRRRLSLAAFTLLLWLVQLTQVWALSMTVTPKIPFLVCASLAAVALMLAQLPVSFGGIGVRDIVLVLLLAAYIPPEQAAAIGLLTAMRNLLPPLAGLPLVGRYLPVLVGGSNPPSAGARPTGASE
jgi:glycosyltransferase 2 family protein